MARTRRASQAALSDGADEGARPAKRVKTNNQAEIGKGAFVKTIYGH
jgi:hypothetical protein